LKDGHLYLSLVGDPTLVATGLPNQVALLSLANSTGTPNVDVVMAISNDGGNSFGNLTLISDENSDATSQGCVAAPQSLDQPKLVMEKGGTNVGWAYWNAKQLSAQFCDQGTYWNPYVRRIQFTTVAPFVSSMSGVRDVRRLSTRRP